MRAKQVGYHMSADGKRILGLQLHAKGGSGMRNIELFAKSWSQTDPQWTSMDLPNAKEIIGVYGTKEADAITSFGFVVAVPNPQRMYYK